MPYPNEHACRIRQPGEFQKDSFVRTERNHEGKKYSVIQAKLKGESTLSDQAYRYPKDIWSESATRTHCKSHKGILFEPASGKENRFAIPNSFDLPDPVEGKAPQKIHILSVGHWVHPELGPFDVTKEDLNQIEANYNRSPKDLVFDYEHQTLYGGEAPAAGWIKSLQREDGKLFAMVDWTDKAAQYIVSREYRFVSPVIVYNAIDKNSGEDIGTIIHSVALTNSPVIEQLDPIINKDNNPNSEESKMKELFQKLAKLFGLKDDAEAKDVTETIEHFHKEQTAFIASLKEIFKVEGEFKFDDMLTALKENLEVVGKIRTALSLKENVKSEEIVQKIIALSDPGKKTQFVTVEEHNKLKQQLHEKDVDEIIAQAKPGSGHQNAGKVVPANEKWAREYAMKDLDGFREYLKTAPVLITAKEYHKEVVNKDDEHHTPEDLAVADMLGVELAEKIKD